MNAASHAKQRQMLAQRQVNRQFSDIQLTEECETPVDHEADDKKRQNGSTSSSAIVNHNTNMNKRFSFENDHIDQSNVNANNAGNPASSSSSSSSFSYADLLVSNRETSRNPPTHNGSNKTSSSLMDSFSLLSSLGLQSPSRNVNDSINNSNKNNTFSPGRERRQESIANVQHALGVLQESIARVTISPHPVPASHMATSSATTPVNVVPFSSLSPRKTSPRTTRKEEEDHTNRHNRPVVSQSVNTQTFSSHTESAKERRPSTMQTSNTATALSSVSVSRPESREPPRTLGDYSRPGSTESGRKSAMRNAGGLLFMRNDHNGSTKNHNDNDNKNSVTHKGIVTAEPSLSSLLPQRPNHAPLANDPSSRMFALAAALDAGDAMGKLMADMVAAKKAKRNNAPKT